MEDYYAHNMLLFSKQLKSKSLFYPNASMKHADNKGNYLPCKLISRGGCWHIEFTDGYDYNLYFCSVGRGHFSMKEMRKMIEVKEE